MVEGTIGKWLKQPGDSVRRYEPLVEVVTDKVTMEVPSPVEGELLRLLAAEGETLPMGAPIAEVGEPGELPSDDTTAAPAPSQPQQAQATQAPVDTTGYLLRDVTPVGPTGGAAVEAAEPMVGVGVQPAATPPPTVATISPAPEQRTVPAAPAQAAAPAPEGGRQRLSPAVRRLAREHSVDLTRISGTGLGGRITRDDVLRFLAEPQPAPAVASTATAPMAAASASPVVEGGPEDERVPLTPVRRMIAEAMVRSVTEIPHAWSTKEVDVSGLVALRQAVRSDFERREGISLTYMPFVIQAVVEALRKVPTMNASWGGDAIILKRRINLGLAVAAPNGLIVPVIHGADRLNLVGLAHAVHDITERARTNRLAIDDVQGGTFTLNNTGALGSSLVSGPIINHPQAGIMTSETIEKRAVVRNDAIAIRSMMNVCLSFDHRINDGAEASAFLDAVKTRLESFTPDSSVH